MVSVNLVYKTLLTVANSDVRGNITPTEFNLLANDSVEEIYEEYLYDVNRFINRQNRGLVNGGLENLPMRIREKIQHFSKDSAMVYSAPNFQYPADHRWTDLISYNGTEIEICPNSKEFRLISGFSHTAPTVNKPIGLKQGELLKVLPATIVDSVDISYLRNPVPSNWTYNIVSNAEIFNPDATDFADIDLHSSEFNTVVVRIAKRFGINLKEQDLAAAGNLEQNTDFQQELQS